MKSQTYGEDLEEQISPEEERRRQIILLVGLFVVLLVVVVYQVANWKGEEEIVYRLRTGPDEAVSVVNPELVEGLPIYRFMEQGNPNVRHLAWGIPGSNPEQPMVWVSMDFLPIDEVLSGEAEVRFVTAWTGLVEWTEDGRVRRGIPDAQGGFFDVTDALIRPERMHYHREPLSLPPLVAPDFVSAEEGEEQKAMTLALSSEGVSGSTVVAALKEDDRVLGVAYDGVVRAYPTKILSYHKMLLDDIGGTPVLLYYSPLACAGWAYSYEEMEEDDKLPFAPGPFMYAGTEILRDVETRSFWAPQTGKCVAGDRKGESLPALPVVQTTWSDWRRRHPNTEVLSASTELAMTEDRQAGIPYGFDRYGDPLTGKVYHETELILTPLFAAAEGLQSATDGEESSPGLKDWVLGVRGEVPTAYPIEHLADSGPSPRPVALGDRELVLHFDVENGTGYATRPGTDTPVADATLCLWFAWKEFYPETEIFR